MDIRPLTDGYAVSPQIDPADLPAIAAAGYRAILCNRPDDEVGPDQSSAAMRAATEAAGLQFFDNPVINGAMGQAQVDAQAAALARADGPVLAYCRSGTRSCFVWAFGAVPAMTPGDVAGRAAAAGYDLTPAMAQLSALAAAGTPPRGD